MEGFFIFPPCPASFSLKVPQSSKAAALSPQNEALFRKHKVAWKFFEAQPPGYRHQMLWRIVSAKRPATKEARLLKLMEACDNGQRLL